MRFPDIEDFFRGTGFDQLSQHFPAIMFRVLDLGMQFSIRKGASASFAELHVRFRVQLSFTPETERISGAFADVFAPFQNDWFKAALCKNQCRKKSAGAAADDDGTGEWFVWRVSDELVFHVRRLADMWVTVKTFEKEVFIRNVDINRIGKDDRGFFSGIVIPAVNSKAVQFFFSDKKTVEDGFFQIIFIMINRQSDFS